MKKHIFPCTFRSQIEDHNKFRPEMENGNTLRPNMGGDEMRIGQHGEGLNRRALRAHQQLIYNCINV